MKNLNDLIISELCYCFIRLGYGNNTKETCKLVRNHSFPKLQLGKKCIPMNSQFKDRNLNDKPKVKDSQLIILSTFFGFDEKLLDMIPLRRSIFVPIYFFFIF
jgi:hypothetical protein